MADERGNQLVFETVNNFSGRNASPRAAVMEFGRNRHRNVRIQSPESQVKAAAIHGKPQLRAAELERRCVKPRPKKHDPIAAVVEETRGFVLFRWQDRGCPTTNPARLGARRSSVLRKSIGGPGLPA